MCGADLPDILEKNQEPELEKISGKRDSRDEKSQPLRSPPSISK